MPYDIAERTAALELDLERIRTRSLEERIRRLEGALETIGLIARMRAADADKALARILARTRSADERDAARDMYWRHVRTLADIAGHAVGGLGREVRKEAAPAPDAEAE